MPRVVKSSQVFQESGSVVIDNRVPIPSGPSFAEKPDGELTSAQQEQLRKEEEESRIQSEVDRRYSARMIEISNKEDALLELARGKAEYIENSAQAKADGLLDDARAKAQEFFEEARNRGFAEGLEAGRKEGLEQCESYIKAGAQFLAEINARKEAYYLSHQEEAEALILEMVKKITLREIELKPEILTDILADAAKRFRNSDHLKISLAKGDVSEEVVTDQKFLKELIGGIGEIEVELLPEATPGTVILDNGSEILDASVPTQLEFLKEIMENSRKKPEKED